MPRFETVHRRDCATNARPHDVPVRSGSDASGKKAHLGNDFRPSQVQAVFTPDRNAWSIGEILDHLLLTDQINYREIARLIQMAKGGQKPIRSLSLAEFDFSPAFIPRPVLPLFEQPFRVLNISMSHSMRELIVRYRLVPARNADIANPRKERPINELRNELESYIADATILLNTNSDLNYRGLIFEHPVLGTNSVLDLLRLIAAHEFRHQDQISPHQNAGLPGCFH